MDYYYIESKKLLKIFFEKSRNNPTEFLEELSSMKKIDKYKENIHFRLIVDIYSFHIKSTLGINENYFKAIENINSLLKNVKLDLIEFQAYFFIGIFYSSLDMVDQALKSYMKIINHYSQNKGEFLSIAYYFTGREFQASCNLDIALNYYMKAIKALPNTDFFIYDYESLIISYYMSIASIYAKKEEFIDYEIFFSLADKNYKKEIDFFSKINYFNGKMIQSFLKKDTNAIFHFFQKSRDIAYSNRLVKEYLSLFNLAYYLIKKSNKKINLEKYISEINTMICSDLTTSELGKYYRNLLEIYENDEDKKEDISKKFISYIKNERKTNLRKYNSILLSMIEMKNEKDLNSHKNMENEKSEKRNKEIEENIKKYEVQNKNLENIVLLGEKLTSTLETKDIVVTILNFMKESLNISCDSFSVVFYDKNRDSLIYDFLYEDGEYIKGNDLSLSSKHSYNVICFKEEKSIVLSHFNKKIAPEYINKFSINNTTLEISSALFIPIKIKNKTIGVISIQSKKENSFNKIVEEYINLFMPYISIALHNSYINRKLIQEVQRAEKISNELNEKTNKLEKLSNIDGLTEIDNRRCYDKKSKEIFDYAVKNNIAVHVFMFDIDHFKKYNDTYGHLNGDEILKLVAKTSEKYFNGKHEVLARFGGEEFIGVFIEKSCKKAYEKMEEIRKNIENLNVINENTYFGIITISIGLYSIENPNPKNKHFLKEQADAALYKAKKTGRNKTVQFIEKNKNK